MLDKPLSWESLERAAPFSGPHQWCENEVRGAARKICGPPIRGGKKRAGDPPLKFKKVDSEGEEKERRLAVSVS
ncbi:hypothetical protein TNCV_1389611 [Trichonephila clavipes]|nr:hypothetical protein TNCV_1544571 [Trichonephila clavipes]GFU31007.1 hypothetical protein TNCV_1389611 [Trichonephila clavipes]